MRESREAAHKPEDIARLVAERANARDAVGLAALYEPNAVLAYPPGSSTVGRDAIRKVYEQLLGHAPKFQQEEAIPTVLCGDLALTSTRSSDNVGVRVQVARRQPNGTWLRIIDRPEIPGT